MLPVALASSSSSSSSSLAVFRRYIRVKEDGSSLDASGVLTRECFEAWQLSRKRTTSQATKSFQRTLSAHITGIDNRSPFSAEEERALLLQLRKKTRWPCFAHLPMSRMGEMGFRAKGYHEKLREEEEEARGEGEGENALGTRFHKLATIALERFPDETSAVETVYGLARLLIVSTGIFSRPTQADAEAFLIHIQEQQHHQSSLVIVFDCTCQDWNDRRMAQSANCEVGGGSGQSMLTGSNIPAVFAAVARAFNAPNTMQGPVPRCHVNKTGGGGVLEVQISVMLASTRNLLAFVLQEEEDGDDNNDGASPQSSTSSSSSSLTGSLNY